MFKKEKWHQGTFTFVVAALLLCSSFAEAQRRGGRGASGDVKFNIGLALTTADQTDLNKAMDTANTNLGGTAKNFGSAYEFFGSYIYRFDRSMYSFVFRPSYMMQNSGDYKLSGFTAFPMLRLTPLENSFIKFFMQGGVGYGSLSGEWKNSADNFQFKGSAFGATAGIGVDFCVFESSCITIEGNARYLPIERNVVSSSSACTTTNGFDQCDGGQELEAGSSDVKTTMSGIQGAIAWTFGF